MVLDGVLRGLKPSDFGGPFRHANHDVGSPSRGLTKDILSNGSESSRSPILDCGGAGERQQQVLRGAQHDTNSSRLGYGLLATRGADDA
jgi:hypothetical protein